MENSKEHASNKIVQVIQIALGASMLFAAFTKTSTINKFIDSVQTDYGLGILAMGVPLLVLFEIYLGTNIILFRNSKKNALYALYFLVALTGVYFYGHVFHSAESCNCFGGYLDQFSTPWTTYIRNIILIGIAYIVFKKSDAEALSHSRQILISLIIVASFIIGFNINKPRFMSIGHQLTKQQPKEKFERKKMEKEFAENYQLNEDKSYMLFFFSLNCHYCLNSIENVKCYKEQQIVDSVIFVNVADQTSPHLKKLINTHKIHPDKYPMKFITRNKYSQISHISPTSFIVKNNKILIAHRGLVDIPLVMAKKKPEAFKLLNRKTLTK